MSVCDHHDCLRTLEVARVFDALASLWQAGGAAAAPATAGAAGGGL